MMSIHEFCFISQLKIVHEYNPQPLQDSLFRRTLLYELLDFIDPVVDHLGSRHRLAYIHKILDNGTGADRQLKNIAGKMQKYMVWFFKSSCS